MADRNLRIWEPFRELVSLREDMDRLFDTFFGRNLESSDRFWTPTVDIEENNGNLVVKAELPGMKKEDIKVSVEDGILKISGERKHESETKEKTFHRIERCYGKFQRMIRLPYEVETDKVKAAYKDGVLNITMPKPESMKPKQIDVDVN